MCIAGILKLVELYVTLLAYKLSALVSGVLLCLMGYSLFVKGIWGDAGDLDVRFKDKSVVLRSAAPGTFFTLLGAIVILATVWQGLSLSSDQFDAQAQTTNSNATQNFTGTGILR